MRRVILENDGLRLNIMAKKNEKIVVVLLTHNRKELLQQGLEGLFNQTHPINKIIIVDSLSTDGTYETLYDKGIIDQKNIRYERLNENKGPSGGFAEGINFALEENPDWIWILDDDIKPHKDCLKSLYEYKDISQCIAPLREGKTVPFFNPAIGVSTHRKSLSFDKGKDIVFSNTCCFEGMLIHKDVVSKIGTPDERFFQVYSDTIYGFVASLYTNIVHVKKAVMHRLLPEKKPITNRRVYLLMRNHVLVRQYLTDYGVIHPLFFNTVFVLMIIYYSTVMTIKSRSWGMPYSVIKGLIHGYGGKFGSPK